jgi:hypothetical protein
MELKDYKPTAKVRILLTNCYQCAGYPHLIGVRTKNLEFTVEKSIVSFNSKYLFIPNWYYQRMIEDSKTYKVTSMKRISFRTPEGCDITQDALEEVNHGLNMANIHVSTGIGVNGDVIIVDTPHEINEGSYVLIGMLIQDGLHRYKMQQELKTH